MAEVSSVLICPLCEKTFDEGERCPEDGSLLYALSTAQIAATVPLAAGDSVAGKYDLIEEIERRGGAGRTFRAMQTALEREVELRILPANSITKPSDHARFSREVATWGRLRSDHLVRLYDSGFTDDNSPYMALEWVDAGPLGPVVRKDGALPMATCKIVAEHALLALDTAHDAQVLHRDISPDALVLGYRADGTPYCRLTGFGLAKHMGDDDDDPTAITMTGQVVGNPAYMAPETIMMGTLDPRTDLYTLGVTLYELATGRRPYSGRSLADMLHAHVKGVPDPIRQHCPDVDPGYANVVTRLLAKDPADRFQTADEARKALASRAADFPAPRPEPRHTEDVRPPKAGGVDPRIIAVALGAALALVVAWFTLM